MSKKQNSKFSSNHKIFGYEVSDINITKEEEFKIRKMINSTNNSSDITIKFDKCGNVCEEYDSKVFPHINVKDAVSKKLYMIFVENYNSKYVLVFKTVFYDSVDDPILTTYEIGKMN